MTACDGSDKTNPANLERPLPDLSAAVQSLSDAAVPLLGKTCEMLGQLQDGWLFRLLTIKTAQEGLTMLTGLDALTDQAIALIEARKSQRKGKSK